METIEVKQSKKKLIPMLCLLTVALCGITYFIYFSGKFENNNVIRIVYVFLTASLCYVIFTSLKKLIKNEPLLIFSKETLWVKEKLKPTVFTWTEIIDWNIEKDESTYYLNINTVEKKTKINISWLEKQPKAIEEMINQYKNS